MIEVDLTQLRGWTDALGAVPDKLNREMLTSTRVFLGDLASEAKQNAPVKDGPLRADIRVMGIAKNVGDAFTGKVGTDLVYSAQREYGGTITARNGGWLVFRSDHAVSEKNPQGWVKVKSVTQTGSFYLKRATDVMEQRVAEYYQLGIDRALEGVF